MLDFLTDDEVVTVAIFGEVEWPYPLATVPSDPASLTDAASRGARSLVARGLAVATETTLTIDDDAMSLVTAAAEAPRRAYAYTAPVSDPADLSGSAIYLYQSSHEKERDVFDLVNIGGAHKLRWVSRHEGVESFLATLEEAFSKGVHADEETPGEHALFAKSNVSDEVVRVSPESLAFGHFRDGADGPIFVVTREADGWNSAVVSEALAISDGMSGPAKI